MTEQPISIVVVDDSHDLTAMLETLIGLESDMRCVAALHSADGLLDSLEQQKPDVVLLDLTMPGRDPLATMAEATARFPDTRFVVISGFDDPGSVKDAVTRGAWGFVSKHGDVQKILDAVRAVAAGEIYVKPR